ncbi:MAG TPA: hypothetical protein VGV89_10330 [Thermoplasmata archaeon]|nr:hypothetical protein [Thermoplasmata archaeon]
MSLLVVVALFVFLLGPIGSARAYNPLPNQEPNPEIEGNVTFSSHINGWGPLTYSTNNINVNGTLTGVADPRVPNPFLINPSDVIATTVLQTGKAAGLVWNTTTTHASGAGWICQGGGKGEVTTLTVGTANGATNLQFAVNTSAAGTTNPFCYFFIPVASLPSTNPAFDYMTTTFAWSGSACGGCSITVGAANESTKVATGQLTTSGAVQYTSKTGVIEPVGLSGGTAIASAAAPAGFWSASMAQISSANLGMNLTGYGVGGQQTQYAGFYYGWGLPQAASTTYTFTVTGMAVTSTALTLGPTTWYIGKQSAANATTVTRQVVAGNDNLTSLGPSFTYSQIAGGGYTVGVVQRAQDLPAANVTIVWGTASVANASGGPSYVEQLNYQFSFGLATAASLTYSNFKLVDQPFIAGLQYVSVTFGGTSYSAAYQGYTPCVAATQKCTGIGNFVTVQGTVTATTVQSWVGIIYYTGPQWDALASPPGVFSTGGILYYWFIFLGILLSVAGASSAWVVGQQRALRGRARGSLDLTFSAARRRLHDDRRGNVKTHHMLALIFGGLMIGAGLVALWAFLNGADLNGLIASFFGGLILIAIVGLIAFVVYEATMRYRHGGRHHHNG